MKVCYLCGKKIKGFLSTEKLFKCHLECCDKLDEYRRKKAVERNNKRDKEDFKRAEEDLK